jgi:hypothetical protein
MAKDPRKLLIEPSELSDKQIAEQEHFDDISDRNEELCGDKDIRDACLELYKDIERGFSDQWERSNAQMDYWDIYNCELGPKQFYSGNSKIFVPIVHDAINARKVRNTNQIFPPSGKNVEVITSESRPEALLALLEFYIRKTRMRSQVVPQLLKNGDVEGHYNVYMSWSTVEHHVTWRVERKHTIDEDPDIEDDESEPYWDIAEETIEHACPDVEVLADADVLVLPFTARGVKDAIDSGGSVTVIRRWSKAKIRQMIRDGEIDETAGEELLETFSKKDAAGTPSKEEKISDSAGVKIEGSKTFCLVYETWAKIKVGDDRRIMRIRFGSPELVVSVKRNPYWCDAVPLISAAANPVQGAFKGRSELKNVETLQYYANDTINEAADSSAFGLMPIIMTDPAKNPRTNSMILNVGAVWETSPKDTTFAQFPPLYKEGLEIITAIKGQIFQTLGINPAMLPQGQSGQKGKPSQAQVAQEQMVDILTVSDIVTGLEMDMLTPILRWFVYLDHQFRDKPLTLRQFGIVGKDMNMQVIEPVQMDRRWEVKWFGVEAARSAQQIQMQMAGLNMIRGIPPQQYKGFELNLSPVLQAFMENLFGPRVAGEVFMDTRKNLSLAPEFENTLLAAGAMVPVSPLDKDPEHMKVHAQLFQEAGDLTGVLRDHMMRHQMQMQAKNQAQMQQAMQQQQQPGRSGIPGGAGPGVPGTPRMGAQTQVPRGGQQPPGVIHQDQIRDPRMMPRARGVL